MNKAIVLLSSGLDSTVNLYIALREFEVVKTLTFDYGQRAAAKEIERSKELSELNKIPHQVVDLKWMKDLGASSLTNESKAIPSGQQVSIDNLSVSKKTAKAVWVPNRNGVFINVAAAFAESAGAKVVIPGFNAEEAATFPDNSFDFMRASRKALSLSTSNQVEVQCTTVQMSKVEIVKLGMDLLVPFEKTWPCYHGGEKWCGKCESCQRAARAFKACRLDLIGCFA